MRRLLVCSLLGVALNGPAAPVCADRLHLESGGVIETGDWWIEGDKILYRSSAGTVGIPRSMVLRIEHILTAAITPGQHAAPARERSTAENAKRLETIHALLDDGTTALEKGDFETASGQGTEFIIHLPLRRSNI